MWSPWFYCWLWLCSSAPIKHDWSCHPPSELCLRLDTVYFLGSSSGHWWNYSSKFAYPKAKWSKCGGCVISKSVVTGIVTEKARYTCHRAEGSPSGTGYAPGMKSPLKCAAGSKKKFKKLCLEEKDKDDEIWFHFVIEQFCVIYQMILALIHRTKVVNKTKTKNKKRGRSWKEKWSPDREMWRLLAATASVWKSNIHYVCFGGAGSRSCRRSQPGSGKTKGAARGLIYTTKRHFTQCDLTALHHCFSKFCQVYAAATDKRKYTIIKCLAPCCRHPSPSLCARCICADCKSKSCEQVWNLHFTKRKHCAEVFYEPLQQRSVWEKQNYVIRRDKKTKFRREKCILVKKFASK